MSECTKVGYPTLYLAKSQLPFIAERCRRRGKRSPRGIHFCTACRQWHLTSRPGIQVPPWLRKKAPRE